MYILKIIFFSRSSYILVMIFSARSYTQLTPNNTDTALVKKKKIANHPHLFKLPKVVFQI